MAQRSTVSSALRTPCSVILPFIELITELIGTDTACLEEAYAGGCNILKHTVDVW